MKSKEFLTIISDVYDEEIDTLKKARKNKSLINYIVGKIMVKSKGEINPVLALTITKAIVNSDLD